MTPGEAEPIRVLEQGLREPRRAHADLGCDAGMMSEARHRDCPPAQADGQGAPTGPPTDSGRGQVYPPDHPPDLLGIDDTGDNAPETRTRKMASNLRLCN